MHLITLHFDNEIDILTLLTDFSLRKYEIIDSNNWLLCLSNFYHYFMHL